jgi:predicted RND superfamily exporter protein
MTLNTAKFAKTIVTRPWLMIFLCLIVVMAIGYGGKNLQFNTNYRVFFAEENPQLAAFDEIERVYIKTDNILFTVKPEQGDVFQPHVLKMLQELTAESWKLPYSQRVDSITNFQHSYAEEDDLTVGDLVEKKGSRLTQAETDHIKTIALNEPLLVGKVLSRDATTTGINVLINLPGKNLEEVPKAANAARALVEKYKTKYPNIEIRPSGMVFMNNAFMESSMQDMATLTPVMFCTLMVVALLMVRSISATLAVLVVILFSTMAAMGFGGWMGFPLSPPSAITPTIVLTLAIADSIHIIMSMKKAMQQGIAKRDAIIESLRINIQPVFLTSLTTVIGFLSLNFSESPPFWHLGNMTAFGVAAAFVFSIVLLPALLVILPIKIKKKPDDHKSAMDSFADLVIKFNKPFLIISIIITISIGTMISRIEINDQFVQYFDESISFRPDTEFMMKNLSGIYSIEYSIGSLGAEKINQPEYLSNLEKFTQWLRLQPEVDHVFSMADIFKRLNKNMHGDNPEWYRIPDEEALAGQYLLLYEFSLPYGLDLNDRINIDKSATRLTVTVKDISTRQLRAFKALSEKWLQDNTPQYMHSRATSPAIMFAFISDRNVNAMVKGNIFSLVLISGVIMLALRSFSIGLISMIPNLAPIAMGFGIWGVLIGQINMAAAFAFAACLGIIVDDTVHFLSKYIRARREENMAVREAVHYAFHTVGSAMAVTTVILMAGFMVMAQSGFQMNSYLGLLTAIVIGSALFLDFFLLPPLLISLDEMTQKLKTLGR